MSASTSGASAARSVPTPTPLAHVPGLTLDALRLVWAASKRRLVTTTLVQLAGGVGVAVQLLVARRIMQQLVAVSHGASAHALYASFAMLVGVTACVGAATAVAGQQQRLLVEDVGRYAFDRIMDVASSVDYPSFEDPQFHDQLQRARISGEFRIIDMVASLTGIMTAALTTVSIAVVLAVLQPLLLVFVLLAAMPGLLTGVLNSRRGYTFEHSMTSEGRERGYIVALLSSRDAAKEIRLFGLGGYLRRRYAELTEARIAQLRSFLRRHLAVNVTGTVAGAIGMGLALASLVLLLEHGRIGVATALTAGVAMQQLSGRLTSLTGNLTRLIESGMFIDDFTTFLDLAPPPETAVEPVLRGHEPSAVDPPRLRLDDVSFTYPGMSSPALAGVSLEVAPGEVVALVGENGSGKTTLVKLICQLYRPEQGAIYWDGEDTARIPAMRLRDDISVVFQDFIQFQLTVNENIGFGRVQFLQDAARIADAAREAGADEFLRRLARGYETRLGRQFADGHELSVGQWQRVALARAFFRGSRFLILDEPTAALDPRAERELFAAMRRLAAGRSVLLISHRFSSVRSADRIYVLESGRLIESGTHSDLVAAHGKYAQLFTLQAEAYRD